MELGGFTFDRARNGDDLSFKPTSGSSWPQNTFTDLEELIDLRTFTEISIHLSLNKMTYLVVLLSLYRPFVCDILVMQLQLSSLEKGKLARRPSSLKPLIDEPLKFAPSRKACTKRH